MPPADLNGLVRFAERRNLVFLRVCRHISTGLYFQTAENFESLPSVYIISFFVFGFVSLTICMPHSVPSRNGARAHMPHSVPSRNFATAHMPHSVPSRNFATAHMSHSVLSRNFATAHMPHSVPSRNCATAHMAHSVPSHNCATTHMPHSVPSRNIATAHMPHSVPSRNCATAHMPHSVPSRNFATAHLVSLSSSLSYINVFIDSITLFCNSFTGFPQTHRQAPRKQDTNWIQQTNYAFLLNLALTSVFPNLQAINLWWPANVSKRPMDTSDNNNNNDCSFYSTLHILAFQPAFILIGIATLLATQSCLFGNKNLWKAKWDLEYMERYWQLEIEGKPVPVPLYIPRIPWKLLRTKHLAGWYWYTLILIHTDADTHWRWYTLTLIQTDADTHWRWYALTLIRTDADTNWRWYKLTLIQTDADTHWRWYKLTLIHTDADTHW